SQLKADLAAYEAGLENRYFGRASLLPQINANANYTVNKTDIDVDVDPALPGNRAAGTINRTQTGWGVSLEQPLFDMSAWYNYQQGIKLSEQAEAQFGADQQSLIVRVAEAYFNVLRAIDTLEATIAE